MTDLKEILLYITCLFGYRKYDMLVRNIFSLRIPLTLVLIVTGLVLLSSVNIQEVFAVQSTVFVLIDSKVGTEVGIINKLKTIQNVKEVYARYGVHEIIVKVQANISVQHSN